MIVTLFVFMTILNEINSDSNIIEKENERLDKNLKILRRDFNNLIENVEDFGTDFLKQIQEASELVGVPYPNEEDYNWQDSKSKLNEKPPENSVHKSPTPTSTEPPVVTPPKIDYSSRKKFPAKYIGKEELSNTINRIKRSNPNKNLNNAQLRQVQERQTLPVEQGMVFVPTSGSRPLNAKQQENILGAQPNAKIDESNTNNNKNSTETQQTCSTKTQTEIEMEKQKLENLKSEVKKLNELVALLKDQQKLMKDMSQKSINVNTNEIDGDSVENSFLYKTLKRLQEDQKTGRQKEVHDRNMNVTDAETEKLGPTYRQLNEMKLDLRETVANLNQTKELLMKEKEKEEILESELKRQNSELKFLKAMMENLYDKSNKLSEYNSDDKKVVKVQNSRSSNFRDMDIDSILGTVHTPKPWPDEKSAAPIATRHVPERGEGSLNGKTQQDIINNDWRSHNTKINGANRRPSSDEHFNLDRRESKPTENQDSNVHRLLTVLNRQDDIQNDQLSKTSQGYTNHSENNDRNKINKTSTARASSKMDDIDFKLKLIDMISKQGRSDDLDNKEKQLDDAMRDLLQSDEKSDNDATLAALKAILKQSKTQKNTQGSLSKILKNINTSPQSKSDDTDIETELRQLQKAINFLRPKEDNDFNRLDFGNNRRGKDDGQDFQSMLSQIIAQNGASSTGLAGQPTLNGVLADKNSVAASQQLLSQYLSSGNIRNKQGYAIKLPGFRYPLNGYGSPQYGTAQVSPPAGMSFAYSPNSYEYGPSANIYSPLNAIPANPYDYSSNNAYNTQLSNIYSYGALSNPGVSKAYVNSYTNLNPSQAVPDYSTGGYSTTNSLRPYSSSAKPIIQNQYIQLPYNSANSYSSVPASFTYGSDSYIPNPQPQKSNYQTSSYPSGIYPPGSQPSNNYQSASTSGKVDYNGVAAQSYTVGGLNKYPVAANSGYQSNSGGIPAEKYVKPFFQYGSSAGGGYTGHNSGSASYVGSGMDQPYGTNQYSDQYKYDVISDLNQQIQNLENIITGLNRGGYYSQTTDGKATIAGLEQRIYELKAVLESLGRTPSATALYTSPQTTYQSYKATQPTVPYDQIPKNIQQSPYADSGHIPFNTRSKAMNYAPLSQTQHNLNAPDNKNNGLYAQKSPTYSPSQSAQFSYGSANSAQSPGTTPYQATQSNYNSSPQTSLPPSSSPQSPYQSSPQETVSQNSEPYQPPNTQASDNALPYQPKESSGENARTLKRSVERYKSREKRQIMNSESPSINNEAPNGADITIGLRQAAGNGPPHSGYVAGDDALTQVANIFRKYLEENLTQSEPLLQPGAPGEAVQNQQLRNSALDGLQQKLDALKLQLESQISPAKSFINFPQTSSTAYGSPNNYFPKLYDGYSGYTSYNQVQKVGKSVGQDIFTKIVLIILDKVLNSVPDILGRLFGNVVSSVGDSYGDSYSPSQNVLRNLGFVGYFPLILVKLLDSLGIIIRNLKSNQLFKQFLLPAIVLGLVGGGILFIIYFFQQDEPYGYIGYQGNNKHNTYPKYEHSHYNNHFNAITNSNNNYGYDEGKSYVQPYRSNMNLVGDSEIRENINKQLYANPNYRFSGNNYYYGDPPTQYSRGYYDYFNNRFR